MTEQEFLELALENKVIKKFLKLLEKSNHDKISSINLKHDKIVLFNDEEYLSVIIYQDSEIFKITSKYDNDSYKKDETSFITITKDKSIHLTKIDLSKYNGYFNSPVFEKNKLVDIIDDGKGELKPFYENFIKFIKKMSMNKVNAYLYYEKLGGTPIIIAKNKKIKVAIEWNELFTKIIEEQGMLVPQFLKRK